MRGTFRRISLRRRLIIDLMHASRHVPFITLRRTISVAAVAHARATASSAPGWAAIFTKAFCLVARDEPVFRQLYIRWPWPHFYELSRSVASIAVARRDDGEDCVLMQTIRAPEDRTLAEIHADLKNASTAPADSVAAFRRSLLISRFPLPLRRLIWWIGLNIGRQRGNHFGNLGVTSVSAFGPGELHALSPGPFILSYGVVDKEHRVDVVIRWDHNVTDAAQIAALLTRLEQVLNGAIADEIRASAEARAATSPT